MLKFRIIIHDYTLDFGMCVLSIDWIGCWQVFKNNPFRLFRFD